MHHTKINQMRNPAQMTEPDKMKNEAKAESQEKMRSASNSCAQTKTQSAIQKYSTLPITNNFMFCKVMSDETLCKEFLEVMLKIKVDHIEYINSEQEMSVAASIKAIRLDVYVDDGTRVFDIEMQMVDTKELPKRARYYQSLIDTDQANKGMLYMQLKESFVIFMMPEDIFEGELSCYTFENICRENPSIKLDDKTTKIFYNFNEYAKEKDADVRNVLNYFATGKKSEGVTERMQELLDKARNNTLWLSDYIRYEHDKRLAAYELEQAKQQAMKEGLKEGLERGLATGKKEGMEQGAHNKAVETAINAFSMGLSFEQVSMLTGLSVEEITSLQTETA